MIASQNLSRIVLTILSHLLLAAAQPGCQTQTRYNPIAAEYPLSVTGVANGTFSLLLIEREVAASLLPEGLGLLGAAHGQGIRFWSEDSHPVLVRAVHVHDTRAPDDMWRNDHTLISFELPFVDALGDGATPFRFAHTQLLQTGTPSYPADVAEQYAVPHVIRSVFDPECDAYQRIDGEPRTEAHLRGIPADGSMRRLDISAPQQLTKEARPFDTEGLMAIVNQPRVGMIAEGPVCGRTTVFFGEEVGFERWVETKGEIALTGEFESLDALLGSAERWGRLYGIRVGTAFVDEDFVECSSLAVEG